MQSEERQELKQNDLQEFLANFGEFWKQWGNAILIAITLAVVVFAGYRIYSTRMQTRYENTWADLALTSSPASFAELGRSLPYAAARAVANLNGADLYLQEATDPSPAADGALSAEEKLNRAQQLYQAVLDEDVHAALHLNAGLGLAEVAVARQQFDEATQQFEHVLEQAGQAYPVHAGIARQRLAEMDRLRHPVPLAEDPAPAPEAEGPAAPLPPMLETPAAPDADAETDANTDTNADTDAAPAPPTPDDATAAPPPSAPAEQATDPSEDAAADAAEEPSEDAAAPAEQAP